MKKMFILGFMVAAAIGFGCGLTNYELITDNDQGGVVNTNGKAFIIGTQVATIWPDGTDNLIWFVDQRANGDRTLTTYNHAGTESDPDSIFMDNKYCSPDWDGCSIVTADDPETNDVDIFDYRLNANCSGFRSLSLLLSTTRYYGECGRTAVNDRTTRMLGLGNDMTPVQRNGATWLQGTYNARNMSLTLNNNNGSLVALPVTSQIGLMANFAQRRMIVDLTNPNNRSLMQSAINWDAAHPGSHLTATITLSGQPFTFNVKANPNAAGFTQIHY